MIPEKGIGLKIQYHQGGSVRESSGTWPRELGESQASSLHANQAFFNRSRNERHFGAIGRERRKGVRTVTQLAVSVCGYEGDCARRQVLEKMCWRPLVPVGTRLLAADSKTTFVPSGDQPCLFFASRRGMF